MQRFKNILLVAENHAFTSEAFAQTLALAERNDARLSVIDVIDPTPSGGYESLEDLWAGLRTEQIRQIVGDDAAKAEPIVIAVGSRFVEIIRHVLRADHDLVVTPDTNEGYNSTTLHLLRKCPVPVWVMKPGRAVPQRILAAVDPDPDDPIRDSLNTLVLDLATSLARRTDSELAIVHAWNLPGESNLRDAAALGYPDIGDRIQRARLVTEERAKRNIESLLDGYDLESLAHRVHIVNGRAGDVVPDVAMAYDVDLIVMGTVARTDTPGLFIGQNAEMIIQNVDRPILAVKPMGFQTPVRVSDS
ncbi:MAG: universal stress protein [Actinomycetota bacterium]|nr:universal stress protein [Actinomycetota bacterium]